jgi:DNA-binding GntR family transcriptional regulator
VFRLDQGVKAVSDETVTVLITERRSLHRRHLRRDIASGRYPVGEQLPSARELADRYGVAGMTVTNAIGVLRDEGLVTTRQGSRGATVIATPDTKDADAIPERSGARSSKSSQPSSTRSGRVCGG